MGKAAAPDRTDLGSGAEPKTAIVHHRSGIGDLVWHVPYIRAIAQRSAGGKVTVIARPSCRAAELLAGEAWVERVIEFDHRPRKSEGRRGKHDSIRGQLEFVTELKQHRFDRIYIFSSRPRYGILALLAGIPQRAGFGFNRFERLFLNVPRFIERHRGAGSWVYPEASAFAIAHGFVDAPAVPKLALPADALAEADAALAPLPRPRYALAIGASDAAKNWGSERFATLAEDLTARGCGVLLLGGPAERAVAEAIIASLPQNHRGLVLALTQPSVLRSAAALRLCDFCIGNDTGMLNVAAASDVPALGLFGATLPLSHDPILRAVQEADMASIRVAAVIDALAAARAPGFATSRAITP
jgi:heptosyltransferase-2